MVLSVSSFLILFATFLGLFLYVLWKYLTSTNQDYWKNRHVFLLPVTKVASAWDRLTFKYRFHELEEKQHRYVTKTLKLPQGYYGVMEFRRPVLNITDFDLIKAVMVKDFEYFVNRRQFGNMGKTDPLFHGMLINLRDQEWKNMRATLTPTFTTGKIRRMYTYFTESSLKLKDFIKEQITKNSSGDSELDLHDVFTRYTMDVISSAAFGVDSQVFKDTNSTFYQMAKKIQNQFDGKNLLKLMAAVVWPKILEIFKIPIFDREASEFFAKVVHSAIIHREASGEKRSDFLQLLLDSKSSTNTNSEDSINPGATEESSTLGLDSTLHGKTEKVQMSEQLILAQCLLFFIAGFDTTESLLLFAAYELALNPEVQEKLYEELNEVVEKSGGSELDYDGVMGCQYLDKVVSETLRKYPPAIRTERMVNKPYKIPDSSPEVVLETGTIVAVSMYGIHHDEEIYPNPDKFDPERFSEENKAKRHPYAYMPFGFGPRSCIANRFALAEGKSAIAHLVLNFQFSPGKKTEIPVTIKNTNMKPEKGMWLEIKARN